MVRKGLRNDDVIDGSQCFNGYWCCGMPLFVEPGKAVDLGASEPGVEEQGLIADGDFPGSVLVEALEGDHGLVSSY